MTTEDEALYRNVGRLTRQLHDALRELGYDRELGDAVGTLPDARDRLSYVSRLTGEAAEHMAAELRWSVARGIWGWFDDDIAFTQDWGFDLASITVPVHLWQGSDDLMVPFAHGRWLAAQLPGAHARLDAGEGHLSLIAHIDEGMAALRDALQGR